MLGASSVEPPSRKAVDSRQSRQNHGN
uniref:Uncharacterized protein n=1 Tax=Arundo donax TaxID=35708 RepID=A0A0A8ZF30_ARUDO